MNQPLPVELLVREDQRRLSTALGSSKPLPASGLEECGELLRTPRRVTVDDHHRFRTAIMEGQASGKAVRP